MADQNTNDHNKNDQIEPIPLPDTPVTDQPKSEKPDCDITLEKLQQGDLYVLGKLWIDLLKIGLLGTNWCLIPTVHAATPVPPQKPPPMRYKDLPLYDAPHHAYRTYLEDKERASCPKARVKLLHEYLLPKVRCYRQSAFKSWSDLTCELKAAKKEIKDYVASNICRFKKYMRDPENLRLRQVVLVMGGATGYYLGSGRWKTSRKIFGTGCGILAAGALCFPKETDKNFREFTFQTATALVTIYNKYCGHNYQMSGHIPCKDQLPGPPQKRVANKCPPPMK